MPLDLLLLGSKIRRYREQFALSIADVATATGIAEVTIRGMEEGSVAATGDAILILADFFKCDYKYFLSNERLTALEQTEPLFRRYGREFSPEDRWAVQEFLFLSECEHFLQGAMSVSRHDTFTFAMRGTHFKTHAVEAARSLRLRQGYRDNEIPSDVYGDFRSIGIHVFRRTLRNSKISGLFVQHPTAGACILVNYSEDIYRQRFTAAHEAAHALFDAQEEFIVSFAGGGDPREVRANAFASAYLLPAASLQLIPDVGQWTIDKSIEWAKRLQVSTQALSFSLSNAKLVDNHTAELIRSVRVPQSDKWDPELPPSLTATSHERKEASLSRGLSTYYVRLSFEAYRNGVVSLARLGEMLLTDSDNELRDLAQLYRLQV